MQGASHGTLRSAWVAQGLTEPHLETPTSPALSFTAHSLSFVGLSRYYSTAASVFGDPGISTGLTLPMAWVF